MARRRISAKTPSTKWRASWIYWKRITPRKLVAALRAEGHEVESVITLRMQGLDNGKLYQFAIQNFEACFTRDFGFISNVRQGKVPEKFKLLRVTLEQKPQDEFIEDFVAAFRAADLKKFQHGDDWL